MFHFTDSASKTEPSWYVTSLRSVNVMVLPSGATSHFSASQGTILPDESMRTIES